MNPRYAALLLAAALLFAAATDYIPAFIDRDGLVFGLFRLDIYKDALHILSGLWAAAAAVMSRRASILFLRIFGVLYFADGVLGLFTGAGYLDLSIVTFGVRDWPLGFKFLTSLPHLGLGAFAATAGWMAGEPTPRERLA